MSENEHFNENVDTKNKEELLEKNNIDLLVSEKENDKKKEEKELDINNDEIEIYSPEMFNNLLVQKESNDNIMKEEEKGKINGDENNIKKNKKVNNIVPKKDSNIKKDKEILNFEDLMERKKNNKNKKSKSKNRNDNNKKSKPKIDFNGRLYQPKKDYSLIENNINKVYNKSKTKQKSNSKLKRNKSDNFFGYEQFLMKKRLESKSEKNLNNNSKKVRKNNLKIINDFLMRNAPKTDKEKRKKIEDDKNINKNIEIKEYKKIDSKSPKAPNKNDLILLEKFKDMKIIHLNQRKKNRFLLNSSQTSKSKNSKKESKNKKELRIVKVPNQVIETEIDLALKNKINQNMPKFGISKYEKFDTEKMRYELTKNYTKIKPNKENGFLGRMQFYSLKRKREQEKINKLIDENKYKLTESQRIKAFNRLMDDANRRITKKNQIEEEKMNEEEMRINTENNNSRKYSPKVWNKIYKERFKEYEEYKKKKIEIEIEKEKIEKMIEEEKSNEDNIYSVKKIKLERKRNKLDSNFEDKIMNKKIFINEGNISRYINKSEKELNIKRIKNDIINMSEIRKYENSQMFPKNENKKIKKRKYGKIIYINSEKSFNIRNIKRYFDFKKIKNQDRLNLVQIKDSEIYSYQFNENKDKPLYLINNFIDKKQDKNYEGENIVNKYLYNYCLNKYLI